MSNNRSFGASLIAGVVLLPAAAMASVFLVGNTPPEPDVAATVDATVPAVVVVVPTDPEVEQPFLSDLDIWQACVPDAAALLEKEIAGTITPIEDAALDALRGICAEEGMPLDGPPAPPPITKTIVIAAPAAPASATAPIAIAGSTDPEEETTTTTTEQPIAASSTTTTTDPTNVVSSAEAEYLTSHAAAVAAIDEAVAADGSREKIDEARQQLAEAEAAAAQGNYSTAIEKAREAIDKARESVREGND